MRQHSLTSMILGLTAFAMGGCADETTAPSTTAAAAEPELAVASNTWLTPRDMWGIERSNFVTATVRNSAGQSIVYVIGGRGASSVGLTSVMAYNVVTNTWTLRAPLPFPLYGMNGAGVVNGKIYIAGGYSYGWPMVATLMYDPGKNTWTRKSSMPRIWTDPDDPFGFRRNAVGGGVNGVIGGKLYVLTECTEIGNMEYYPCPTVDEQLLLRYNPVTDGWTRLASPPGNGWYISAMGGVIGGKLYVVGASGGEGRLAVYDPATNKWAAKRGLGLRRDGAAAVAHAGKLYLMGGIRFNADETSEVLWANIAYDPTTDRWTNYAPLPTARTGLAGSRVLLNGLPRIEVIGGSRPGNNLQYIP